MSTTLQDFETLLRCHYRDTAGRRCRRARKQGHPTYCGPHAATSLAQNADEPNRDYSRALVGPLNDFRSLTAINYTLGRLLVLKAAGQISFRDASAIAYICQLLIQTVPGTRQEKALARGDSPDDKDLQSVIDATSVLWDEPGPELAPASAQHAT